MRLYNFNFEVVEDQVDNALLLEAIHRLRYQVYVREWGFEDPADHPEGLEKDDYDQRSRHIYVYTGSRQNVIGTARLILPSSELLPLQKVFEIDAGFLGNPEHRVAEISRLAISKEYRRREIDRVIFSGENAGPGEVEESEAWKAAVGEDRRKCEHELIRGIYLLIYRESLKLGLTHWCAAMARGLYVLLLRWGIPFEQIGPAREYHGLRAPFALSIRTLEKALTKKNPELLQLARQVVAGDG